MHITQIRKKPEKTLSVMAVRAEIYIMITVITMMLLAIPTTGFAMGKDLQFTKSKEFAGAMSEAATAANRNMHALIEDADFEIAPNVRGMKESAARKKLKEAKVNTVRIKKKKMTYEKLVKISDDLFFHEVQAQEQSLKEVTLTITEPDMKDHMTREMIALGGRLAWPLPGYSRISSMFGHRASPGGVGSTNHQGIDIPAPTGTPIIAIRNGVVRQASPNAGYGNCVIIDHGNGYESLYGHMSKITCNPGDEVKPGDVIGKVGSTGWSTGAHLHLGILKNGQYVDPLPYFNGKEDVKAGEEVSENEEEMLPEGQDVTEPAETTEPSKPTDPTKEETKKKGPPKKPSKPDPTKPAATEPIDPEPEEQPPTEVEEKPEPTTTQPATTSPPKQEETESEDGGTE